MAVNVAPVDGWTAVHVAAGFGAGLARVPAVPALTAALAFELVEPPLEAGARALAGQPAQPESEANRLVDLLASALGYGLGAAIAYGARAPAR